MKEARKLDALFASPGVSSSDPALAQTIIDDPRVRAAYRRRGLVEAALCDTGDDEPTAFSYERVERLVLALSVAAPRRRLGIRWAFPSLAGAVAAMALWVWLVPAQHRIALDPTSPLTPVWGQEVRPRGTKDPSWNIGIRVLRVEQPGKVDDSALGMPLSIDDTITFSYSAVDGSHPYLTLIGLQPNAPPIWYYPDVSDDGSIAIKTGVVDEPFGDGFVLQASHHPGPFQIVALFGRAPLDGSALERLSFAELPVNSLTEQLGWPDVREHSLLLNLREVSQ